MSEDLPTVDEIILSLENHPELMKELRQRLIWTCQGCGGEKTLNGKECTYCDGTGSLPLMILTHRQFSMRQSGSPGSPVMGGPPMVQVDLSFLLTAPHGADQLVAFFTSLTGGNYPWK